jgi:hypothetical protein
MLLSLFYFILFYFILLYFCEERINEAQVLPINKSPEINEGKRNRSKLDYFFGKNFNGIRPAFNIKWGDSTS